MERSLQFDSSLSSEEVVVEGRFIAEVINVLYMGSEELSPEEQLGTITLCTNLQGNHHFIYKVQSVDLTRPSIKPGDFLTLTGPSTIPSLSSYVSVDVDLFSGAYKGILCVEVPPSRGRSFRTIERRLLSEDGTGELCFIFGLSYNARAAFLDLKWVDNSPTAQVYGVIAARASKSSGPRHSRMLLVKQPEYRVRMGTGDSIPLSRSMIAVPIDDKLSVEVGMQSDHGTITGIMVFRQGTLHRTLYGDNGDIRIEATVEWRVTSDEEHDGDIEDVGPTHEDFLLYGSTSAEVSEIQDLFENL